MPVPRPSLCWAVKTQLEQPWPTPWVRLCLLPSSPLSLPTPGASSWLKDLQPPSWETQREPSCGGHLGSDRGLEDPSPRSLSDLFCFFNKLTECLSAQTVGRGATTWRPRQRLLGPSTTLSPGTA